MTSPLPVPVDIQPRLASARGEPGDRWANAHGVAMLSAAALTVISRLPFLTTTVGFISLIALIASSRGAWTPSGRFGLANTVTSGRLLLIFALVLRPEAWVGHMLALTALAILALDLVDGSLARHFHGQSRFGARFDMEVDALFVLALSCALWSRGVAGAWVLLAGLWRYLFVVVPLLIPSRGGEAPRSLLYRSAYSVMVGCFLTALVAPSDVAPAIALVGTLVLSASFLRSFWYRYRPPTAA
jgi:phosphatidylglycerophosphate synthase